MKLPATKRRLWKHIEFLYRHIDSYRVRYWALVGAYGRISEETERLKKECARMRCEVDIALREAKSYQDVRRFGPHPALARYDALIARLKAAGVHVDGAKIEFRNAERRYR